MGEIKELIKICNSMYIKQIKKILKHIEKADLEMSCINNLCASGELIIEILKLCEKDKINVVLPCLRNVYEMTLKAVTLDGNKEIKDSYNKILKKIENDSMDKVRRCIGNNFNKYFSVIERDEIFEDIFKEGILTYIYKTLCRYSHATKVNEFVYLVQRHEKVKDILNCYLIVFLIYPIILVYMDAVCTKLNLKELIDEIVIIYTIITFNLLSILLKDKEKVAKIKKFSEKILGKPDELFKIRIEKEQEVCDYYLKDSKEILEYSNSIKYKFDLFIGECLKKYFTTKQLAKIQDIIKNHRYT